MTTESLFSVGDWVVHSQYGVGQIKKQEVMPLNGVDTECFMAEVQNGSFWFPADAADNPRIRPVDTQETIQKVIRTLRRKAANLDGDKRYWDTQIRSVPPHADLLTISKLIRDLTSQKSRRRLNDSQTKAMINLTERLVQEWTAITGADVEEVRTQVNSYLEESKAKLDEDPPAD